MTTRVALVGVGTVGSALLARLERHGGRIEVVHVCSSRQSLTDSDGIDVRTAIEKLRASEVGNDLGQVVAALGSQNRQRVVVDATASAVVAGRHASWLREGIHVVTASKIANGGTQAESDELVRAARAGSVTYGASATVGAGLPLLRTIAALRAGGDEITKIVGVLSGSLTWILDHFARARGERQLDDLVAEAHRLGLTEPDPEVDLSGRDVVRKLLVLARAAGARVEAADVELEPIGPSQEFEAKAAEAARRGERLGYVGSWEPGCTPVVGLRSLPLDDPIAAGGGCDNRVAIWSSRYADRPLVVQGPGAGAGVTAAALLDDIRAALPRSG